MNYEELVEAVARDISEVGGAANLPHAMDVARIVLRTAEPLIRADERKRVEGEIVAWLRAGFDEYPHGKYGRCSELQNYWTHAASAIEAGDYRKGEA